MIYGLLALDPVESGREAKYAHEGSGDLLVARCNGSPLLSLAQSRSTTLRLVEIHSGPATGASCRCGGMAGFAPRLQTCSRKAWLV
jgi:hypothetical protein